MRNLRYPSKRRVGVAIVGSALLTLSLSAQESGEEEEVFELSPFEVSANDDQGYRATNTLAGTRITTDLSDIGTAISVLTKDFIEDVGAIDNQSVLSYALNTEVGGPRGNFSGGVTGGGGSQIAEEGLFDNPNGNTRIRGLSRADNTRNYFLSNIPWDSYNTDRVDLQRGPNAILFGLGSPAGVINATTMRAHFGEDAGVVKLRTDQFGTFRLSGDYNQVLVEDQLAARIALLRNDQKYRQWPTFREDERVYLALNYTPTQLNGESTLFQLTGNYENGSIESNVPRTIPAIAPYLESFFAPVSEGGTDGRLLDKRILEDRLAHTDDYPGNYSLLNSEGVRFHPNGGFDDALWRAELVHGHGTRRPDGTIAFNSSDGSVFGQSVRKSQTFDRVQALRATEGLSAQMQQWLDNGLVSPFSTISDTSVFDFYNESFEGPNKREFRDWDAFDIDLTHTFFDNKLGYNLSYHKEDVETFRYGLLGWFNTIRVDVDETLMDVDIVDGELTMSENPNVGRPYIEEQQRHNNRRIFTDRTQLRAQLFAEHDFTDHSEGLWARVLGRHRLTALYEEQEQEINRADFRPGNFGPDFYEASAPGSGGSGNGLFPSVRYYLGDSIADQTSLAGSNLTGVRDDIYSELDGVHTVYYWDSTWTAGDIYGEPWTNPNGEVVTQSENPANYAGWTEGDFRYYTIFNPDQPVPEENHITAMEYLQYGEGDYILDEIESQVAVWQAYLWNDSIVGTYGYREDTPRKTETRDDEPTDVFDGAADNTSWSVALHANRLLGDRDFLPLNVSLYYSEGSNIQPLVGRIGADGRPLMSPSGTTEEWSVLLRTKDNKFSLRATEYETIVSNQTLTAPLDSWVIQQALGSSAFRLREINEGLINVVDAVGGDQERADFLVNEIAPAYESLMLDLEETYPDFVETWVRGEGYTFTNLPPLDEWTNGNTVTVMRGSMIEDARSSGYEFEFTANPTPNWRIAINASKTEAIRDNVPGPSWTGPIRLLDDGFTNTLAGQMPLFNYSEGGGVFDERWNRFRAQYLQIEALNGLSQPEIREWRYNMITNYTFRDGKLKGLGIGGAYKWSDENIIEFMPVISDDGILSFDLDSPIMAPSEDVVDLWASYQMPFGDKVDWKIQLNIFNALGDNELIPFNMDPDGTVATARIKEGTSWALTNTFEF